jgi:hypothetical protein
MMNSWVKSLTGTVTLSSIAFLAGLAQLMLFVRFLPLEYAGFLPVDQPGQVALGMLPLLAVYGGWVWALLAAARGSWWGLIAALIYSVVMALAALGNVLVFCGGPCAAQPVGDIIQWATVTTGLVASVAIGVRLRQGRVS